MNQWWNTISGLEQFFWMISIPFTVIFLLQLILNLMGLGQDVEDADSFDGDEMDGELDDGDGDDGDGDHDDHGHSGHLFPFKLVTIRNFIVFFTIFGWTGIVMIRFGFGTLSAAAAAAAAGFIMSLIMSFIFFSVGKLSESGNLDLRNAMLITAETYLTIPAQRQGRGKIQIAVQGRIREYDAETEGDEIPTGTKVRVVEVVSDELLIVAREVDPDDIV